MKNKAKTSIKNQTGFRQLGSYILTSAITAIIIGMVSFFITMAILISFYDKADRQIFKDVFTISCQILLMGALTYLYYYYRRKAKITDCALSIKFLDILYLLNIASIVSILASNLYTAFTDNTLYLNGVFNVNIDALAIASFVFAMSYLFQRKDLIDKAYWYIGLLVSVNLVKLVFYYLQTLGNNKIALLDFATNIVVYGGILYFAICLKRDSLKTHEAIKESKKQKYSADDRLRFYREENRDWCFGTGLMLLVLSVLSVIVVGIAKLTGVVDILDGQPETPVISKIIVACLVIGIAFIIKKIFMEKYKQLSGIFKIVMVPVIAILIIGTAAVLTYNNKFLLYEISALYGEIAVFLMFALGVYYKDKTLIIAPGVFVFVLLIASAILDSNGGFNASGYLEHAPTIKQQIYIWVRLILPFAGMLFLSVFLMIKGKAHVPQTNVEESRRAASPKAV